LPQIISCHLKDMEVELEKSPSRVPFVFKTDSHSNIGLVRTINEDAFYVNEKQGLWLVADGMGGHMRGDKASASVIDSVRSFMPLDTLSESIKDLETRLLLANNTCRNMYGKKVVGSTIALLFAYESLAVFLWVGDSRIYRLRRGSMTLLTEDHSLVQERFRRGEISRDEAQTLPSANVLTRAIGIHQTLRLEMQSAVIRSGDRFLICSDGLYRELTFKEVQTMLNADSSGDILNTLIQEALDRGGKDNITGILISVD
jgi:protein phosphatase